MRAGVHGTQDTAKVWLTVRPLGPHTSLVDISPCGKFKVSNWHTPVQKRGGGAGLSREGRDQCYF